MGSGRVTPMPVPAERGRFELPIPFGIPVFETGALDQLSHLSSRMHDITLYLSGKTR